MDGNDLETRLAKLKEEIVKESDLTPMDHSAWAEQMARQQEQATRLECLKVAERLIGLAVEMGRVEAGDDGTRVVSLARTLYDFVK